MNERRTAPEYRHTWVIEGIHLFDERSSFIDAF